MGRWRSYTQVLGCLHKKEDAARTVSSVLYCLYKKRRYEEKSVEPIMTVAGAF
jgi:hypothetical protein